MRAARQGAPHGFRYKDRLLDVDFGQWMFYIGPTYRVVYISGWPASHARPELQRWAYDIPYVTGASVCALLTLSTHPTYILIYIEQYPLSAGKTAQPPVACSCSSGPSTTREQGCKD